MASGSDKTRYVVPISSGGWDAVKERHELASAHADRKVDAVDRAREIVRNLGGGEVRIQNKQGRLIDSDTIKPGRESPKRVRK